MSLREHPACSRCEFSRCAVAGPKSSAHPTPSSLRCRVSGMALAHPKWSRLSVSNRSHLPWKGSALPTELSLHRCEARRWPVIQRRPHGKFLKSPALAAHRRHDHRQGSENKTKRPGSLVGNRASGCQRLEGALKRLPLPVACNPRSYSVWAWMNSQRTAAEQLPMAVHHTEQHESRGRAQSRRATVRCVLVMRLSVS